MINDFLQNRKGIQATLREVDYLKPLEEGDSEITIYEERAAPGKLKQLNITNIPVCQDFNLPFSWLIELEIQDSLFSAPPRFKSVEKALAIFSCSTLYIIFIEMKSSLTAYEEGLGEGTGIEKKISDSISRTSLILTNYVFTEDSFKEIKKIKYVTIIVYNVEEATKQILEDKTINATDIVKEFVKFRFQEGYDLKSKISSHDSQDDRFKRTDVTEAKRPVFVRDYMGRNHPVEIHFIHNIADPEKVEIDLMEILSDNEDFMHCVYTTSTLPNS